MMESFREDVIVEHAVPVATTNAQRSRKRRVEWIGQARVEQSDRLPYRLSHDGFRRITVLITIVLFLQELHSLKKWDSAKLEMDSVSLIV